VWTARSLSGAPIVEGANVVVVQIDGATAVVDPAPGV
jgi:membrane protein implicated in regulation of membrane protease activity